MILIEICHEFRNHMKGQSFRILSESLYRIFADKTDKVLLLGNLRLGAFDFDALLFCDSQIVVFEFKKGWGQIKVMKEGPWLKGYKKIWSGRNKQTGTQNENPLVQMKVKRNILYGYLKKHLKLQTNIACFICFEGEVKVNDSNKILENNKWLGIINRESACNKVLMFILNDYKKENTIKNWDELLNTFHVRQTFSNGSTELTPNLLPCHEGFFRRLFWYLTRIIHLEAA